MLISHFYFIFWGSFTAAVQVLVFLLLNFDVNIFSYLMKKEFLDSFHENGSCFTFIFLYTFWICVLNFIFCYIYFPFNYVMFGKL